MCVWRELPIPAISNGVVREHHEELNIPRASKAPPLSWHSSKRRLRRSTFSGRAFGPFSDSSDRRGGNCGDDGESIGDKWEAAKAPDPDDPEAAAESPDWGFVRSSRVSLRV